MDTYTSIAKKIALSVADQLLDEDGNLDFSQELIPNYLNLPGGYSLSDITEHIRKTFIHLRENKEIHTIIKSFSLPLVDPKVEEVLAITIGVDEKLDRRGLLLSIVSAIFCPLRQHVGSCFATAPAILIHKEQPLQFLKDLKDLLTREKLSRTFGGVEYSVPISPSPGLGDLKKPFDASHPGAIHLGLKNQPGKTFLEILENTFPKEQRQKAILEFVAQTDHLLLKLWEYTLASFVDVKTEFSRWNLFSSLGLHPEEKGGIGELIYSHLEEGLKEANEKIEHYNTEVSIAFDQMKVAEALFRLASTESEGRRLKAEHMARVYHLRACEDLAHKWADKGQNIANFFPFLIEQIIQRFPEYFQEIYDPEMQEVMATDYDDAPAGFRLLFKHGRSHVASWTFIYTKEEYIAALKEFFLFIEPAIKEACKWEGGKEEITQLITKITYHITREDFLVSSFYRMAKAHKVPLQKIPLEQMEKKPWAYTSGGTMPTLLKTYFRREGSLSEEARWVDSPQDLLIFLLDTLKTLSPRILNPYIQDPTKRMLMTSPTHAFSLLPGAPLFRKGWEDPGFTYTFVRDHIKTPRQKFFQRLEPFEQRLIVQRLDLPFDPIKTLSIPEFRKQLPLHPKIDSLLFELLPLTYPEQIGSVLEELQIKADVPLGPLFRRELHDFLFQHLPHHPEIDMHREIAQLMEKKQLSPPIPLIFADTNWPNYYFAFLVNPATDRLELWRTDLLGITGFPMKEWEPFLNGTIKQSWGIYLRPYEYTM